MTDTPRTTALAAALLQRGRPLGGFEAETENNGPVLSMERLASELEEQLAERDAIIERLREVAAGSLGYLLALPEQYRPDEAWLKPLRAALAE